MIESIKARLWNLLKEKEVSLAMLYDKEGRILWHRGRKIKGKTITEGEGFSKSYIENTLHSGDPVEQKDVVISLSGDGLPLSARILYVKSLLIQPVTSNIFLYVDSGIKESFSLSDCEVFKVMGHLLGEMIEQIKKNQRDTGGISGSSRIVGEIREQVVRYSLEEEPVLLIGETGVGKNHVAELIHRFSGRKGPFVVINTPSIPETLFESELFGHIKGAFTGAAENKKGLVREAEGGTLFFDEIGEISLTFQAKLLQLIDTKKYRSLGDPRERTADVRIVAAGNRDLKEEIDLKRFRQDLYFRLNVLPIKIPPLRERKEDIREIVAEYSDHLRGKETGSGFWEAMFAYDWPGNVRELIHVLKRAGIQLPGPKIDREIEAIIKADKEEGTVQSTSFADTLRESVTAGRSFWDTAWKHFLNRDINRYEMITFLDAYFIESDKNLKAMSQRLNIKDKDYPRFISALHKYGIHPGKKV
ncbi:MAG: sigma-54-dependent Fis family transcriptional regulator [Candidatus Aminicenantes bacterium]|nr:sigma-54-dependent Fis family transcriptional regulator [Candidatus Aminicenantes bacterium]